MSSASTKNVKLTALETTEVVLLLRQHFDAEKGAYHDGWSDLRIATHVKCKLASVEHVRTQHFGRLRTKTMPNTELINKQLADHQSLIDALTEDMSKLRADFVQLVGIVRYHVTEQSLKNALIVLEKRYPLASGLKDSAAYIPPKGDKT